MQSRSVYVSYILTLIDSLSTFTIIILSELFTIKLASPANALALSSILPDKSYKDTFSLSSSPEIVNTPLLDCTRTPLAFACTLLIPVGYRVPFTQYSLAVAISESV